MSNKDNINKDASGKDLGAGFTSEAELDTDLELEAKDGDNVSGGHSSQLLS